jgi:REP element-mobilizing transposase RayT
MRNTFYKLWTHVIFKTAPNYVLISAELSDLFFIEIEKRFLEQACPILAIGGMPDHVHILFEQNPLLPLHDTLRFVQDWTQVWYQKHDFSASYYKFRWHEGYAAYSVSESNKNKVADFIQRQTDIHEEIGVEEEIRRFNLLHQVDMTDAANEAEIQTWANRFIYKN